MHRNILEAVPAVMLMAMVVGFAGKCAQRERVKDSVRLTQEAITTKRLEIQDKDGKTRAWLASDSTQGVRLVLLDGFGRERLILAQEDKSSSIKILDAQAVGRVLIEYDPEKESSVVTLRSGTGAANAAATEIILEATKSDGAAIRFITDGKEVFRVPK